MLLRSSKTLVVVPMKKAVVCYDYLTKVSIQCDTETLYWLTCFATWSNPKKIIADHPKYDQSELTQQFIDLLEIGLLKKKGSKEANNQVDFSRNWKFGLSSAILHFTCKDSVFISLDESKARQIQKMQKSVVPKLFQKSQDPLSAVHLSNPPHIADLLHLMAKRRTNRTTDQRPLTKNHLLECLFAGLGITAFTETVAGKLPLKMTPSGGARNPFEAYVFVQNVEGMKKGYYHFSASECILTPLPKTSDNISATELLAGQDWADDMPAIIILVANFERTMWKYQDDNAYRVVMIEAGHVAQNIILAATAHGLSGCPTAALAHSKISEQINLTSVVQNPIYAITLSSPKPYPDIITSNVELPKVLQNYVQSQLTN